MSWTRAERNQWQEACAALRILCPVYRYTVSIRRCRMVPGDEGYVRPGGETKLAVRVNQCLDSSQAIEVLAHEWAHAMTWDIEHERSQSHSAYWGVAYAEAYRAVFNPKE